MYAALAFLFLFISNADALTRVCFSPDYKNCSCEKNAIELLDSAQHKIDIAMYAVNNIGITEAILSAVKRGVLVRAVYDRSQAKASEKSLNQLKEAGIECYYNHKFKIEHNKFIVIDNKFVMNGSFNFTETAEHKNSENCTIHDNPQIIIAFSDRFEYLFNLYKERQAISLAKKSKLQNKNQYPKQENEEIS